MINGILSTIPLRENQLSKTALTRYGEGIIKVFKQLEERESGI